MHLLGINDTGKAFGVSPDPLYDTLVSRLAVLMVGQTGSFHDVLAPILANEAIFAVNLYDAGLGQTVEDYFAELMADPGAVRATLPNFTIPGDISASKRYFTEDITIPRVDVTEQCTIVVPDDCNGVKYQIDDAAIARITKESFFVG
jgi:hypothetical protein